MSEVDDFLRATMPLLVEAERALHDGDIEPRMQTWSRNDPVTVFGAWRSAAGGDAVRQVFEVLATRFSGCMTSDIDLVAAGASGDLAYTVAYERVTTSVDGEQRSYVLRATQVYRREGDRWHVVHHGDDVPPDQPLLDATPASTWCG